MRFSRASRTRAAADGGLACVAQGDSADVLSGILALMRGFYLGYLQGDEISLRLGRCLEALKGSGLRLDPPTTCLRTSSKPSPL